MLQARKKIVDRGAQLGVDFDVEVAKLRQAADWDAEMRAVENPSLQLPHYYKTSFHAYAQGNLCWEAALEVQSRKARHISQCQSCTTLCTRLATALNSLLYNTQRCLLLCHAL